MKVCAFYTVGTKYEELVEKFQLSAENNGIKPYIKSYEPQGSWVLNCGLKPEFIKHCLEKFKEPILYVDIDATFENSIDEGVFSGDICIFKLRDKEILSGTIYLDYNNDVLEFVNQWVVNQKENETTWDQRTLAATIMNTNIEVGKLPATYIKIFDIMKDVKNEVILHHQMSRQLKNTVFGVKPEPLKPEPIKTIEEDEEVVIPRKVRTANNGMYYMIRNDATVEEYMDCHFQRVKNELKWYAKIEKTDFKKFIDKYKNKVCNIIGKGPSLDLITQIDNDGPIICINEAIHIVEKLNLKNDIYCVQQDTRLAGTCKPETGTLFINSIAKKYYEDIDNKYIYAPESLKLRSTSLSALISIEIGKLFGCNSFELYAFDASMTMDTRYARSIGYRPKKHGDPKRFLRHRAMIEKQLEGCRFEFKAS